MGTFFWKNCKIISEKFSNTFERLWKNFFLNFGNVFWENFGKHFWKIFKKGFKTFLTFVEKYFSKTFRKIIIPKKNLRSFNFNKKLLTWPKSFNKIFQKCTKNFWKIFKKQFFRNFQQIFSKKFRNILKISFKYFLHFSEHLSSLIFPSFCTFMSKVKTVAFKSVIYQLWLI